MVFFRRAAETMRLLSHWNQGARRPWQRCRKGYAHFRKMRLRWFLTLSLVSRRFASYLPARRHSQRKHSGLLLGLFFPHRLLTC